MRGLKTPASLRIEFFLSLLRVVLEDGEMEAAGVSESQALVNANGGVVVGKGVQDGSLAALSDFVGDSGDENVGVAVAAGVGMGANGANLDVLRKMKPPAMATRRPAWKMPKNAPSS
jgi:hypothetical protein